jgi:hypothetical protein
MESLVLESRQQFSEGRLKHIHGIRVAQCQSLAVSSANDAQQIRLPIIHVFRDGYWITLFNALENRAELVAKWIVAALGFHNA